MNITRRASIVLMSLISMAAALGSGAMAAEGDFHDTAKLLTPIEGLTDHPVGSETAPVTVIEYASPTCPHCATFHNDVYPAFKAAYIDTGKVTFIVRPFARNIFDHVVFMLAEAAGPDNYHTVLETFFRTQNQWASSPTPKDAMVAIATQLGFTPASFDAALEDQAFYGAVEATREQAIEEYDLQGTPTFYINGKQLTGDKTLEEMAAEIDPLIPADFVPTERAMSGAAGSGTPSPAPMAAEPVAPLTGGGMAAEPVVPLTGGGMAAEPVQPMTGGGMSAQPVTPAQ